MVIRWVAPFLSFIASHDSSEVKMVYHIGDELSQMVFRQPIPK
jgi:hypothetical protein